MNPDREERLFTTLGRIEGMVSSIQSDGCRRYQQHLALLTERPPDDTRTNGNGSIEGSVLGGLWKFKGRGKAAKILAVSAALALIILCCGWVVKTVHNLGPTIKDAVVKELRIETEGK